MFGIGAAVVAAIGLTIYGISKGTPPSRKKVQADLAAMKADLKTLAEHLIPWNAKERELLSYNQTHSEVKKGRTIIARGIFTSIYEEPLIAYSYKRYPQERENALFIARSSNRSFLYRIKADAATIYINNQLVGLYENGVLKNSKEQILAKADFKSMKENIEIWIEGKSMGAVANPSNPSAINIRAFDILDSSMSNRQESIFLAVAILEILRISLKS